MFNKYVSISIPDGDNLKNVVARYTDREINLIDGVNESESLQIHNNFSNNCSYVILLPAEKIFYQSVPVADRDQFKVSEENLLPDLKRDSINFKEDYYYDYLETVSGFDQYESKVKFFAVEKPFIDAITSGLEENKNRYLVSALPVAVFSIVNEIREEEDYLLYYSLNDNYTLITVENNQLELLQPAVNKNELKSEIEKVKKYYFNNKSLELNLLQGSSDLLDIEKPIDLVKDDFVFLASILWSIGRC